MKISKIGWICACSLLYMAFQNPTTLTIEIEDLENSEGHILLDLQDEQKNTVRGVVQEIVDNRCIITIKDLPYGTYGFRYFHDENNNEKLDTYWIGLPKESFGFSNNAKGKFGPPKHEATLFQFTKDTKMVCKPMSMTKN